MSEFVFDPCPTVSLTVHGSKSRFPIRRIYCVGRNFWDHGVEMGGDPTREPPFFFSKPADAAVDTTGKKKTTGEQRNPDGTWSKCTTYVPSGCPAALPIAPSSKDFHYECEMVVAIGKGGANISEDSALDHIFGYAVGVDLTQRDLQKKAKENGRPWDISKGFDRSAPVGAITPVGTSGHVDDQSMVLTVNGEVKQTTSLDKMIWNTAEIIAHLSKLIELCPGDLIYTGTPAGVGSLEVGDKIDARVGDLQPCSFMIAPKVHGLPEGVQEQVLEYAGKESWGPLAKIIREHKEKNGDEEDEDEEEDEEEEEEEQPNVSAPSSGTVTTDWTIEVLDEEKGVWHLGKATRYSETRNSIYVVVSSEGVEGDVALEWEFIKLVKCNDKATTKTFEKLKIQQDSAASLSKVMATMTDGPLTQREVQERIVCSPQTDTWTTTRFTMRVAYLSQRGYYPDSPDKDNQDAFFVDTSFNGDPEVGYFGVFDGHGGEGDRCSQFARDAVQRRLQDRLKANEDFSSAYPKSFTDANTMLHRSRIDDSLSGTTAITVFIKDGVLHIANAGDSRAIAVTEDNGILATKPLSIDQTPYRKDERERCKKVGARIMTFDQLEGVEEIHENWGLNLGEEIDDGGDPPRIWSKHGKYPGCAFTRSIGDALSERLGVFAEPELEEYILGDEDKYIIIASDGVWEFITSQSVADMVDKFPDPLDACRHVVAQSYSLWLQYEDRTDDITMIALYIDEICAAEPPAAPPSGPITGGRKFSRKISNFELHSNPMENIVNQRKQSMQRPLGSGGDRRRRRHRAIIRKNEEELTKDLEDEEHYLVSEHMVQKTEEEMKRIESAVRANFLFHHLDQAQRKNIFSVMTKVDCRAGQRLILQGDKGDRFYIVDSGTYEVRVAKPGTKPADGGDIVHTYSSGGHFGELALLYGKPRGASVYCKEPGVCWALDRLAFRTILMKSSKKTLMKTLRRVGVLKSLDTLQLQRLVETLSEVSYDDGQCVLRQGELGNTFYIITEGQARCTKRLSSGSEKEVLRLKQHDYFGERALLNDEPRAASVYAVGSTKCLQIGRTAFEEVLGPLEAIIDTDRRQRESEHATTGMLVPTGMNNRFPQMPVSKLRQVKNICNPEPHVQYSEVEVPGILGGRYGLKTIGKIEAVKAQQQSAIANERWLWGALPQPQEEMVLPRLVATCISDNCLHMLFKPTIAMEFAELLDQLFNASKSMVEKESAARFYLSCAVLALEYLHGAKVLYRALAPELLMLSPVGYLQLMDYRMAKRMGGMQRSFTMIGTPDYLPPEQVRGQGHGLGADYWGLGVLLYELLAGEPPFAAGHSSELQIYAEVTAHQKGGLTFPKQCSAEVKELLDSLLAPSEADRLGADSVGVIALQSHAWFKGIDWDQLSEGNIKAPLVPSSTPAGSTKGLKVKSSLLADYSGDASWFDGF